MPPIFRIFRLAASYRDHSVEVLVNVGSHNNFIQEGLVDQLGLQPVTAPRFRVYMGNGQFLLCDKICMDVPLMLQGHEFLVDLYVLPICGFDIVLGMQWLRTLGPCVHDHEALTMEFNWKGKRVCLVGNMLQKQGRYLIISFVHCYSSRQLGICMPSRLLGMHHLQTRLDQWLE